MPAGRPTIYKEEYNEQAYKLTLLGMDDSELAGYFGIAESTLNLWKNKHPKFMESIKEGKEIADAEVSKSLNKRARGYEYDEKTYEKGKLVKTVRKQVAPDTGAAMAWLKNRTRHLKKPWSDKQEVEVKAADEFLDLLRGEKEE